MTSVADASGKIKVFDAIAAECFKQEIYVHLDNHVSKAQWCCSTDDGNAWFGDKYFDVAKWKRGLKYMATHVSYLSSLDIIHLLGTSLRKSRLKTGAIS